MSANYSLNVVLTAIDRVTTPLRRINERLTRINAPFVRVNNALRGLGDAAGVPRLTRAFSGLGSAVVNVRREVSSLLGTVSRITLAGAGAAYLFQRQFIAPAAYFERLQISLEGIEGSADKAKQSMAFLKDLTLTTPYQLRDISEVFRMLKGFGMDPEANDQLKNIISEVAKLGGDGDALMRVSMQIGQAWGKTKLQMQDIRPMIENGIPVWQLLQHAAARLGKNIPVKQLQEMSEKGTLGLNAIREMIKQMGIESQGANKKMMQSWTGLVSNLQDHWTFFTQKVMDSGPFTWMKGKLQGMLDTIDAMAKDGSLDKIAEVWGKNIVSALQQAYDIGRQLVPAFQDFWGTFKPIAGGFADFVSAMGGGKAVAIAVAAIIGGRMVMAVKDLMAALVLLNVTIAGTPAGLILMAGAAALGGMIYLGKQAAQQGKGHGSHGQSVSFGYGPQRELGWQGGQAHGGRGGTLDVNVRVQAPEGTKVQVGGRGNFRTRHLRGNLLPEAVR